MVPHARVYEPDLAGSLSDENKHRLERVLRLRPGDLFYITNGEGGEAVATIEGSGQYSAAEWSYPGREPEIEVTIFAALSKGDRLEWLIEKAVEMGVRRIVPLISSRCVVKAPSKNKLERWRKVAVTAMIQCGGCLLPIIDEPVEFKKMDAPPAEVFPILLHEEDLDYSIHDLPNIGKEKKRIWLASGPEGGFDDNEVNVFRQRKWQTIWLGKRLFKSDTAPMIAIANILAGSWGTSLKQ